MATFINVCYLLFQRHVIMQHLCIAITLKKNISYGLNFLGKNDLKKHKNIWYEIWNGTFYSCDCKALLVYGSAVFKYHNKT